MANVQWTLCGICMNLSPDLFLNQQKPF